jgi:mycoredoxin
MRHDITVYGAPECEDTKRTRDHLDELGVDYRYIDVEADEASSERVEQVNDGKRKTPTLTFGGTLEEGATEILSVPDDTELDAALERHGRLPHSEYGDGSPGLERR